MKTQVAVMAGGDSGEYEVSLKSADMVMRTLDTQLFQPWLVHVKGGKMEVHTSDGPIPISTKGFGFESKTGYVRFDVAYNMVHGTPGEDGKLQGWLEMQKVPYTSPGVLASALTMDKYLTKLLVKTLRIPVAKGMLVRATDEVIQIDHMVDELGLPCFVKPNHGGSSVATFKIKAKKDLPEAIEAGFAVDDQVIVESFLPGTELSIGILEVQGEMVVLPPTEIVPHTEFFDYAAKYQGASDEITPARIPSATRKKLERYAVDIYRLLNLRGMVRIDFMWTGKTLYFMEVNTIPGFSPASLVPQQIRAAGMKEQDVLTAVIFEALRSAQGSEAAEG
jgi:D-alanine-D-alanine ligase